MKQFVITNKVTNRDTDSFKQYLKEISSIPLLTKEEELVLLERASNNDRAAINELARRNLRFVVSVAKQYATPLNPLNDLVNEGNVGLIKAAEKFKPEMGVKFISYAVWWVRKIIMEHLSQHGRLVRLPANKINSLSKLDKKINALEQKLGRSVDIQEIIDEFGEELRLLENKDDKSVHSKMNSDYEFLSILNSYSVDSLDRELNGDEGGGTTLSDMIPDNDMFKPTDHLIVDDNIRNEISELLSTLKARDREIMIALFGLDGNLPRTLKDIGDELGVTREMIRQIREKCLKQLYKKLKHSDIRY